MTDSPYTVEEAAKVANSEHAAIERLAIKVGDRVQQIGKARRYPLKVTRVNGDGSRVICVGGGMIHSIAVDKLRKVQDAT